MFILSGAAFFRFQVVRFRLDPEARGEVVEDRDHLQQALAASGFPVAVSWGVDSRVR